MAQQQGAGPRPDPQQIIQCGYCAAQMPYATLLRHDIVYHDGLERVRSHHRLLCARFGQCHCRIEEYEREAAAVARARGEETR